MLNLVPQDLPDMVCQKAASFLFVVQFYTYVEG